jgi:hypothetical protein
MLYVFFWVIPRRLNQTPGNHPEENIQQLNILPPKTSREDAIELLTASAVAKSCCKKQHIFQRKKWCCNL